MTNIIPTRPHSVRGRSSRVKKVRRSEEDSTNVYLMSRHASLKDPRLRTRAEDE